MNNEINTEHPLGKGEVVSSILTGSTKKAHGIRAFSTSDFFHPATRYGTKREDDASSRGKSVAYDRHSFTPQREPKMANEFAKTLKQIDKLIERHDRDGWESKAIERATRDVRLALWACAHNRAPGPVLVEGLATRVETLAKARRAK